MNQPLNRLLAELGDAPADGRLAQIEDRVWRRIASRREAIAAARVLAPVRAVMVGAALAAGLAAGGVAAAAMDARPVEMATLSADFAYAPSHLLEQDR